MPTPRTAPPPVQRLHGASPILQRHEGHPWENKVTFNPACAYVRGASSVAQVVDNLPFARAAKDRLKAQSALVILLYRAQGAPTPGHDYSRSSMGLAVLSPTLELLARHDAPVITPEQDYENLGVEDGRITYADGRYILCYTAYGSTPQGNAIRIALASTTTFGRWEKHGLLRGDPNSVDNKNAMLFEGKADGKFLMLHRPMQGKDAMAIHWAESDQIFGSWKSRGLLMPPLPNPEFVDTWIGGGAPPMSLGDGRYLILYHIGNRRADRTREYDLGLALADLSHPDIIVKRSEPLLRPEAPAELSGDPDLGLSNVAFICGAYFHEGDLYFPYAGADSVVLGAKVSKDDLRDWLG